MTDQFSKDIDNIDRKLQGRILQALTKIQKEPIKQAGDTLKPLSGDLRGFWRFRIGDFRLIYHPDPVSGHISLIAFAGRGGVYE
jgi:mRNA-degrading endonuclease RelE of RelBE toxin-antitoxin system